MDLSTVLLIVLVATVIWHGYFGRGYLAATADDRFVVFDVDAEKRVLTLWFFPIVAFRLRADVTTAITSRPSFTAKLAAMRAARKIKDDMWGVSVSFGRWARNDALFDETGHPETSTDNATFSSIIESYPFVPM